jgi:hypothetical protein
MSVQDLHQKYRQLCAPGPLASYFGVGRGWSKLLENLLIVFQAAHERGLDVEILQVKEKFGALRVYYHVKNLSKLDPEQKELADRLRELVSDAAAQSKLICDVCGASGQLRDKDWTVTRCDDHVDAGFAE